MNDLMDICLSHSGTNEIYRRYFIFNTDVYRIFELLVAAGVRRPVARVVRDIDITAELCCEETIKILCE